MRNDDTRFGPRRNASCYEDMVQQITKQRPDAYIEGSAGFYRSIMSRTNRELCGVAKASPTKGTWWFRLLTEGTVPY